MNDKSEKRMLAECAAEGLRLLDGHFAEHGPEAFAPEGFMLHAPAARPPEAFFHSNNVDLFYASLAATFAQADAARLAEVVRGRDVKADLDRSLEFIEGALYREGEFDRRLAQAVARNTALSDDELRHGFSSRFDIRRMELHTLPRDRSIFFAKVNHGYWEYMRSAYDDLVAARDQFREIDVASKIRRLRSSAVSQFWGRQLHRLFSLPATAPLVRNAALCVSLTAGTEPPAISIRKELQPVTRGAAIGMLSMFETAVPGQDVFHLGDGSATRSLIFNQTLDPFFDSHVRDSEACVIVVPQHLKHLDLTGFDGELYKFLVPPTRVNETWKAVAATLLGYLARLASKHRTITVLGQGASISSLMALLFADLDPVPGVRLRYFDLGRVLDVAAPDFLEKQAWAKRSVEEYVAEGRKVFRTAKDPGCVLASKI